MENEAYKRPDARAPKTKGDPPGLTRHRAAAQILRGERGALSRIARNLGVTRSMISGVLNGSRTSARVSQEIVRECLRLARSYDYAALFVELGAREEGIKHVPIR